jgi:hypothetical protein
MSKLETNQVDPSTGTTLTLGTSGDTIAIPSGVTIANSGTDTGFGGANTPAFEAYLGGSGGQAISDNTVTLVTIDTEFYDTDSAFNTSNYRFTPQVAGKYMVYGSTQNESGSGSNLNASYLYLKKNGTSVTEYTRDFYNNQVRSDIIQVSAVIEFNGSSDYVELYGRIDSISGSGQLFESDTQFKRATAFGAYSNYNIG